MILLLMSMSFVFSEVSSIGRNPVSFSSLNLRLSGLCAELIMQFSSSVVGIRICFDLARRNFILKSIL